MNDQILELLNNPQEAKRQVNQFAQNNLNGIDPQQKVQELLNSGQMSQDQYNKL